MSRFILEKSVPGTIRLVVLFIRAYLYEMLQPATLVKMV